MSRPTVLLPSPVPEIIADGCAEHFEVLHLWRMSDALLTERGADIQAIAVSGSKIGPELLNRLPRLRIIANLGVGYENVDVTAARRQGVVVTNTPSVLDDDVADIAISLLLMTVRELPQAERYLRAGKWHERPYPPSRTRLGGRKVGILGLGRIGKAIARRAEAFELSVSYHNRYSSNVSYRYYPTLLSMARDVDTLIIAASGGSGTRHLVNEAVLEALGPEGVVINVGRGSIVHESALSKALRSGTILAAGLDVHENEPSVAPGLLELPNVVLLPHVGSASVPTRRAMAQLVVDNLTAFFDDGTALNPVF